MARRFLTLKQWRELEAKHLLETEGRVKCLRGGGEKMIEFIGFRGGDVRLVTGRAAGG